MIELIEKIYFKYRDFLWHLLFGILTAAAVIGLYFWSMYIFSYSTARMYLFWIGMSFVAVLLFSVTENKRLIDFTEKIYFKYKEVFWYLVFGALTTVVNIAVYFILRSLFGEKLYLLWNGIAWAVSVGFAYITNKLYVFESKTTSFSDILREVSSFVGCRLFSGILEMVILWITVDILMYSDGVMKIFTNIIVVILNYIFSKLLIFKKAKN